MSDRQTEVKAISTESVDHALTVVPRVDDKGRAADIPVTMR